MYVHLDRLIKKHDLQVLFMTGSGHGAPGVLAPVYLEGSYSEVSPDKGEDVEGTRRPLRDFSFPGTPETPGSVHEGAELAERWVCERAGAQSSARSGPR